MASCKLATMIQYASKGYAPDILDPPSWILDEHLVKLDGPQRDPSYVDIRNCLVFWARPTQQIKNLINTIQHKLKAAAPGIWLMPLENLHMTTLEITHSLTPAATNSLVSNLLPFAENIVNYAQRPDHRSRLIKPMISYDAAALALSFVPAAGECLPSNSMNPRTAIDDRFTYHHFRRDVYNLVSTAGIVVGSRYVVPSAHLTIARFNSPNPFTESVGQDLDSEDRQTAEVTKRWIDVIESINEWLEKEFWPKETTQGHMQISAGGEWIVGEEKGLDFRKGTLWYGGGETILLGKGI